MPNPDRKLAYIKEDGREVYEYPDGAMRYDNGSLAERHPRAAEPWDSETAGKLSDKRWEAVRKGVAAGIMDATLASCEPEAAQAIAKQQTYLAKDIEKGRASTEAAKFLFRAADWVRPRENKSGLTQQIVSLDAGAVRAIMEQYTEMQRKQDKDGDRLR